MTAWDIRPSEVGGVLRKAATAAEGLAKAGQGVQKDLPSAATAAGTISGMYCGATAPTGPVSAALGEFMQTWLKQLAYVAQRTSSSLNGAAAATNAYVEGDLKMAADAQHDALKEPKTDMPGVGKK